MRTLRTTGLAVLTASALALSMTTASAHDPETPEGQAAARAFMADHQPAERHAVVGTAAGVPCAGGKADIYPCKNVDLLSVLPLSAMGGGNGNDVWGWTDPSSGKEYAIVGRTNGTAFVDVSTPTSPRYLGNLPSNGGSSNWRDMKVYKDHAFIVADFITGHGMQVFDLTRLRTITTPQTLTADVLYREFGPAHNIAINEETGFAYAIGSNTCSGGPHIVDVRTPKSPKRAGCVSQDGYTHDTQCVVYRGPDAAYSGKEICFNSNEDTLTIVDVTNKANPVQISRKGYSGSQYSHQGWLTEDQRYFLLDDELDEQNGSDKRTKTYIWDLARLSAPVHTGTYNSPATASDHNQYIRGRYSYQANYQAGLRILDVDKVSSAQLTEVGYFDIYPAGDAARFNGAWSNYPYFASGIVLVNGIEQGLVVVKPNLGGSQPGGKFENAADVAIPDGGSAVTSSVTVTGASGNAPATLKVNVDIKHTYRGDLVIELVAPGGSVFRLQGSSADSADNLLTSYTVDASASAANGEWKLKVQDVSDNDTGYIDAWSLQF
ncbi:choice-of-anchor B domain-containing protein [Saccharothrix tamanrassetensis]|uniref:Choice-of-anchor B domain-containing protein n=1 Tax=Saccharothrix tamanrassetensis TaxID=1051531 RepID=A0A841C9S3_9PSEU|nr:choice-of-anchor B family protein [Saccharothrix tamanrassetensis]MBB5953911.1 choice-of-anchor B domain-containing protein [Saccharothrix tamanrassetensis]